MFELYQRDGHRKDKLLESEELEDIARQTAEMSGGVTLEDLFDWEEDD